MLQVDQNCLSWQEPSPHKQCDLSKRKRMHVQVCSMISWLGEQATSTALLHRTKAHLWGSKVQVIDAQQVHIVHMPTEERLKHTAAIWQRHAGETQEDEQAGSSERGSRGTRCPKAKAAPGVRSRQQACFRDNRQKYVPWDRAEWVKPWQAEAAHLRVLCSRQIVGHAVTGVSNFTVGP